MMGKTNVTIRIDEEVVREAKELGLNISKTCENCLKQAISHMKQLYGEMNSNSSSKNHGWCGGWDLNPRRPTPEDLKSSPLS